MPTFEVADTAEADLDDIWEYLDREASESIADRQLGRLYERFQLLAEQPYMAVARPEFDPDIRSHAVPETRYVILYYPRAYGVEIVRVVHGSRRLSSLFE